MVGDNSGGWREELEGNAVGVAETDAGAIARVFDPAVLHAERIESTGPLLQRFTIGASERKVIQTGSILHIATGDGRFGRWCIICPIVT